VSLEFVSAQVKVGDGAGRFDESAITNR